MPRSEVNLVTLSVTMRDLIPLSVLKNSTATCKHGPWGGGGHQAVPCKTQVLREAAGNC